MCQSYKVWKQFTTDLLGYVYKLQLFSVCQSYKVWKQFTTTSKSFCNFFRLFSVCQSYKVWKQFTTMTAWHSASCRCFQCVKVIKFESNSQLSKACIEELDSCFQCVKVIKFESNSQPKKLLNYCPLKIYPNTTAIKAMTPHTNIPPIRIKSASGGKKRSPNRHPMTVKIPITTPNLFNTSLSCCVISCCFQCVKVIKFESNSQRLCKNSEKRVCCFQCVKVIKFESNSQLSEWWR